VGNGLIADTFWLITVHGEQADNVRNLPAVNRDHPGRRRRRARFPRQQDMALERMLGSHLLTIRIDLDPPPAAR
jgi:hypothetical protein